MTDDEADRRPKRIIHDHRERLQAVRGVFREEQLQGGVSEQTLLDLAAAALQYRDVLVDYRDEDALETPWDERRLDWICSLAGQTIQREESLHRSNGATTVVERPAITAVEPDRLLALTKELDAVAKELGFVAEARDGDVVDDIGTDDMHELLRVRGQDGAAERLPARAGREEGDEA
jgi:hypothetical protein